MKSNRRLTHALQVKLKRFEKAIRSHEMVSMQDRDDRVDIEAELKEARRDLTEYLVELQGWATEAIKP